jgi:hypothetical protein
MGEDDPEQPIAAMLADGVSSNQVRRRVLVRLAKQGRLRARVNFDRAAEATAPLLTDGIADRHLGRGAEVL